MQFNNHLLGPAESTPRTAIRYVRELRRFKQWFHKDPDRKGLTLEPSTVVGSDLRDFRDFLRAETVCADTVNPRKRKAGAVNAIMAPLRSFFFWAESSGFIDEVPPMPKRVKAARSGNKAITPKDQRRLMRAVELGRNKRDMAIFRVLLDCGLRVSELCALKWRDVKLTRGAAELYIWEGKGDKQGVVPLSTDARRALIALAGETPVPDEPVFLSRKKGVAMTPRGVQNLCGKYGYLAKIKFHPHMCRHACATDMLNRGAQIPTVQGVMRHGSHMTTLNYTHTSPELMRKAVERGDDGDDE